jgi:hypothetical protein
MGCTIPWGMAPRKRDKLCTLRPVTAETLASPTCRRDEGLMSAAGWRVVAHGHARESSRQIPIVQKGSGVRQRCSPPLWAVAPKWVLVRAGNKANLPRRVCGWAIARRARARPAPVLRALRKSSKHLSVPSFAGAVWIVFRRRPRPGRGTTLRHRGGRGMAELPGFRRPSHWLRSGSAQAIHLRTLDGRPG